MRPPVFGLVIVVPLEPTFAVLVPFLMAGTRPERILEAVKVVTDRFASHGRTWKVAPDYDVDDVASIVVNAILGYTDYVNRTVWLKLS